MTDLTALRELNERRTRGDWRLRDEGRPYNGVMGEKGLLATAYPEPAAGPLFGWKPESIPEAEANARLLSLATELYPLAEALEECADRLEYCAQASGSDPEYAALAVACYRALLDALMAKVKR